MDPVDPSPPPETGSVPRDEERILERLGAAGLERVLADVFDQPRLVHLANACKLSYPGMRMQAQKRERILRDLAAKATIDDAARTKILRAVRKEVAVPAKDWETLGSEERLRRLRGDGRPGRGTGALGQVLFLAADSSLAPEAERGLREAIERIAPGPAVPHGPDGGAESDAREAARLRKKVAELQKKVRHLEGQLGKFRESEKVLKRDLIQRKGELAEARMLSERLRREVHDAKGSAAPASGAEAGTEALLGLDRTLKRLVSDHKRLAHRIEKLADAPPPELSLPDAALASLVEAISTLEKEFVAFRRERKRDLADQARRLEEIQAAAVAARSAAEEGGRPAKAPARRKGEPERVGVFIDVQNVWYGARQLKGKLDFDALLQAAVLDRRLIQATAYVVESKEIDQSGFIARLDQRGIDVKRKTLKVRSDGSTKGDWDMEMAFDVVDAAPRLHVVVLVTGDGDFTSIVRRVKAIGPRVEVISFPRNTAKSLIEAADKFHPLDRRYMIRDPEPAPPPAAEVPPAPQSAAS
jgi:uncharacterized LabA/DUF88 family protein